MPAPPYIIYGLITGDGTPQQSLTVTITNITLGGSDTCITDGDGHYIYDDLAALPNGYASGNTIRVSVYSAPLMVYQTFLAASEPEEKEVNLTYFTQLLTESVSVTDTVLKDIVLFIGHDVAFQPNAFQKDAFQGLLNTISMTDTFTGAIGILLTESITLSDVLSKDITKSLEESIALSDALSKDTAKSLEESITLSDTFTGGIVILLTESITLSDVLSKDIAKSLEESVTLSDALSKDIAKSMEESISMTDTFTGGIVILLTESITLSDTLTNLMGVLLTESITLSDSIIFVYQFYVDITCVKGATIYLQNNKGANIKVEAVRG